MKWGILIRAGLLLVAVGVIISFDAFDMPVSVDAPQVGQVSNVALLQQQMMRLLVGLSISVAGAISTIVGIGVRSIKVGSG